ncbi:LacI family DNA-binding transcriptional regulator [Roseobacter weihaiensis]|uniref:LacI family DNA-binding transcriptional regulator n=1 Tax=Roseobacter weihaiensis TaxID=2763262 RepID=UPI001D0BA128|nr:LacI family DNA-binding transcriptional regulator [Roseobacter sp. H9]
MADKVHKNADIVAVANAARVSISTVSRSFNHPELVKPATRKKIDRAVRKLGYIRNRAAQTMHGIRSGTIGLVVPTIDNAIFAEVIQTFSDTVGAQGFTILVASHGYDLEREYAVLRKFLEHRVDGVALIGLDHSEETYGLLQSQNIPAITIWNYDADSRLSCVGADNRRAGRMAARHLLELGHREIAVVFPPVDGNDRARARRSGALAELARACPALPEAWTTEARYSVADGKEAVIDLLNADRRPTALLCGNDVLAVGAIHAARRLGIAVPDALSIIGIGDFKGSKEMEPALTTIRLPARAIGQIAGDRLARSIIADDRSLHRTSCEIMLAARDTCRRHDAS